MATPTRAVRQAFSEAALARWRLQSGLTNATPRDSNPCGQSPMDFESISLTAWAQCHYRYPLPNAARVCIRNALQKQAEFPARQAPSSFCSKRPRTKTRLGSVLAQHFCPRSRLPTQTKPTAQPADPATTEISSLPMQ